MSAFILNSSQRFCTASFALGLFLALSAQADLQIITLTGDPAPDANGVFASTYSNPALNEAGKLAFIASFSGTSSGTDDNVAYVTGEADALKVLAREGTPLPSGNGSFAFSSNFFSVFHTSIDNAGNVSTLAQVSGGTDGASFTLVHFDEAGAVEVVRDRQLQSFTETNRFEFDSGLVSTFYHPALGADGELYFLCVIDGPGIPQTTVIYRWTRDAGLEYILGSGDSVLEDTGFYLRGQLRVSSPDKLAITTSYLDNGEFTFESGIAEWTGSNGHQTVIRHNDVAPDGISNFSGLGPMTILDTAPDGRILSSSFLQTPTDLPQGIFVSNGQTVTEIAVAGKEVDDMILRNGIKGKIEAPGITWFTAQTQGRGTFSLFRNTAGTSEVVLTAGDSMPGLPETTFNNIGEIYPNAAGDLLFDASTIEGVVSKSGYYILLANGETFEVALLGDSLAGSIIQSISLGQPAGSSGWPADKHFNNAGQVAFQFKLLDGRSGIALWSPPLPPPPPLTIEGDDSLTHISFTSESGYTYQIEKLADDTDWANGWINFGVPITGNGILHQFTDNPPSNGSNAYYRLKVLP